jgi:hypothetical protein
MGLFYKKKKASKNDVIKSELPKDVKLKDELTELSAIGDRRDLNKADSEVKMAVSKATQADIREIMLIDQGRCPLCHARTENFLFTVVCPSCGWFRRNIPSTGKSIVHLNNKEKIECDYVHHGRTDEYLCIREGVVISEIMRDMVQKIDHVWEKNELEEARNTAQKLKTGICSWCERTLSDTPNEEHGEDFVAFGAVQERYRFCSEKCQRAFRKQYPARIHRNCYERDCNTCNLCIKRYDTHGFKRNILK